MSTSTATMADIASLMKTLGATSQGDMKGCYRSKAKQLIDCIEQIETSEKQNVNETQSSLTDLEESLSNINQAMKQYNQLQPLIDNDHTPFVQVNHKSLTIHIQDGKSWLETLKKHHNELTVTDRGVNGVQLQDRHVSVTIYHTAKKPKILVQGRHYILWWIDHLEQIATKMQTINSSQLYRRSSSRAKSTTIPQSQPCFECKNLDADKQCGYCEEYFHSFCREISIEDPDLCLKCSGGLDSIDIDHVENEGGKPEEEDMEEETKMKQHIRSIQPNTAEHQHEKQEDKQENCAPTVPDQINPTIYDTESTEKNSNTTDTGGDTLPRSSTEKSSGITDAGNDNNKLPDEHQYLL